MLIGVGSLVKHHCVVVYVCGVFVAMGYMIFFLSLALQNMVLILGITAYMYKPW